MPPAPPRTSSNIVPIVLLSLALIVVVCVMVVFASLRFLARGMHVNVRDNYGAKKQVEIATPFGGIQVNKNAEVSEAALGVPVYPGSKRMPHEDSAVVNLGLPGDAGLHVAVAKYETADSIDKVKAFYQDRIGKEVTKFKERDNEGKTVFEIKAGDDVRVVALKSAFDGTRIELVHVSAGGGDTN
jgi:hypothetical protein